MSTPADPLDLPHGPAWLNRYALAPMTNKQSHQDGTLSASEYDWLVARSAGGFGVVTTCAAYVADSGRTWTGQLGISSEQHLPGLQHLAHGLQDAGAPRLVQLHHGGLRADPGLAGELLAPYDVDFVDMSVRDVYATPRHAGPDPDAQTNDAQTNDAQTNDAQTDETDEAHDLLIDHFVHLPRGRTALTVAGNVRSAADAAWALARGADAVTVGLAAVLHHDFARRALLDPGFRSRAQPVPRQVLRQERVSEPFLDYLATDWDDVVLWGSRSAVGQD